MEAAQDDAGGDTEPFDCPFPSDPRRKRPSAQSDAPSDAGDDQRGDLVSAAESQSFTGFLANELLRSIFGFLALGDQLRASFTCKRWRGIAALGSALVVDAGSKISSALRRAAAGQLILLRPGEYKDRLILTKSVRLLGTRKAVLEDVICAERAAPSLTGLTLRASAGQVALAIEGGSRALIEDCDVSAPGRLGGVDVRGEGTAPTIRGCTVHSCASWGIAFSDGGGGIVEGNRLEGTGHFGILSRGAGTAPSVRRNELRGTSDAGMFFSGSSGGTVEANELSGTGSFGIVVRGEATRPALRANRVSGTSDAGLFFCAGSEGLAEANEVSQAGTQGIVVRGEGTRPSLLRNVVRDCAQGGLFFLAGARPLVEGNEVRSCQGNFHGVAVRGAGTAPTLRRNLIVGCRDGGIFYCNRAGGEAEENEIRGNGNNAVSLVTGAAPAIRNNRISLQAWGVFADEDAAGSVCGNVFEDVARPLAIFSPRCRTEGNLQLVRVRPAGSGSESGGELEAPPRLEPLRPADLGRLRTGTPPRPSPPPSPPPD
eukprot:tig00000219_g19456.t1